MVKRSVGALGLLGLVYALAAPAAHGAATVLWQPDLSTGKLVGPTVGGKEAPIYTQGVNDATKAALADDTIKDHPGVKPFVVITDKDTDILYDNTCTCDKGAGWLDNGDADGTTTHDLSDDPAEKTYPTMLLTGDPTWADVGIQCKTVAYNQNTGSWGLVLRATPKTKPDDPDSYYEFRYTSDNSAVLDAEARDGVAQPSDGGSSFNSNGHNLRIMKVVNGTWKMLAELNGDSASIHVPEVNRQGIDHDVNQDPNDDGNGTDALVGYYFRFTAKGNVLTGYVSKDGQKWDQALQTTDNDLKAGLVGFMNYDYRPLTKEILVDDAQ